MTTRKKDSAKSSETSETPRWHELGYVGNKVDPRPNSDYTLGGVIAAAADNTTDSDGGDTKPNPDGNDGEGEGGDGD